MSILQKKQKIFGTIAASRVLTETLPKSKLTSSMPSINNQTNIILFITDLIQALVGFQELVDSVIEILTTSMAEVERVIKIALKTQLNSIVSCGINPSLPDFIKSDGKGVVIEVKKIDFFDILKIDPNSPSGKLIYDDVTPTYIDSSDFNTFLYGVLQTPYTTRTWKGILDFTFEPTDSKGVNPNNSLIIKANSAYESRTINDLNNNYIDSLTLFDVTKMVNKIIDTIFGSFSINRTKTPKQLEAEAKIDMIVDKIIDADECIAFDDSFFVFDSEEITEIEARANDKKRGIIKYVTSVSFDASVPEEALTNLNTEFGTAVTIQEKRDVLTKNLDDMAEATSSDSPNPEDKTAIKLNFFQLILSNFVKAVVSFILSPKVVCIFLINFKIIYGEGATFTDAIDFIKKNRTLVVTVTKKITELIVKELMKIVGKEIGTLMGSVQAVRLIEKGKDKISQLLSLVGVGQEAIRTIKGLI
jgi:hypothetical protein